MKATREEIAKIRRAFQAEAIKQGYGRRRARSEARRFVRKLQATHSLEEMKTLTLDYCAIFSEPNTF